LDLQVPYNESELVALLKQKDLRAFDILYDRFAPAIYTMVLQIVRNKEIANVSVQKVLTTIWCTVDQYEPAKGRLFTWMLQIARNTSIDEVGRSNHQNTLQQVSLIGKDKLHHLEPNVDELGLKKIIASLGEEHKIVLQLCYYQGLTIERMAEILSISEATVSTRKMAALSELRRLLGNEYGK
jgi:RNA polymerase sigma-70 factor (ECF subfamily)